MRHDYLKNKGDLVLLVDVEKIDQYLRCELLYVHSSAPKKVSVFDPATGTEYTIDVSEFKKVTPSIYTGEVKCLILR